jgi:hypothetical protein
LPHTPSAEAIGCRPPLTTITPLGNTGHRTLAGAENAVTSRDREYSWRRPPRRSRLNAGVIVGWRGEGTSVRWFLAELRPAGVVVIDVFDEDVVEMSPARHEDAIGTLAPALAIHRSQIAFARGARRVGRSTASLIK